MGFLFLLPSLFPPKSIPKFSLCRKNRSTLAIVRPALLTNRPQNLYVPLAWSAAALSLLFSLPETSLHSHFASSTILPSSHFHLSLANRHLAPTPCNRRCKDYSEFAVMEGFHSLFHFFVFVVHPKSALVHGYCQRPICCGWGKSKSWLSSNLDVRMPSLLCKTIVFYPPIYLTPSPWLPIRYPSDTKKLEKPLQARLLLCAV